MKLTNGDSNARNSELPLNNDSSAAPMVESSAMIRVFREPEVVVRSGGDSIVSSAEQWCISDLADVMQVEQPVMDSFWLVRPRMNGYNVHDGLIEEGAVLE